LAGRASALVIAKPQNKSAAKTRQNDMLKNASRHQKRTEARTPKIFVS